MELDIVWVVLETGYVVPETENAPTKTNVGYRTRTADTGGGLHASEKAIDEKDITGIRLWRPLRSNDCCRRRWGNYSSKRDGGINPNESYIGEIMGPAVVRTRLRTPLASEFIVPESTYLLVCGTYFGGTRTAMWC